jgi:signal transduction histidine kinase
MRPFWTSIANLLDNAIRHNVVNGTVKISTTATAGGARLTVSNTGPVVPFTEVERLFQPFQRLGDQRINATDGNGLGLTIVKAIATAHDANLTARPGPQGGLDIQVTFRPNV